MIPITDTLSIDESDITVEFILASGPGGQNVNKVATAVQLRFAVVGNTTLPDDVQECLARLAGKRFTANGDILLTSRRYRTQERNRRDAMEKLVDILRRAAEPPRPRKKTRPSKASVQARLQKKKQHSTTKRLRQWTQRDEE